VRRILLVLLIVPAVLGLTALPAHAVTFTVTLTTDEDDGECVLDCTLREAITAANGLLGLDNIDFNRRHGERGHDRRRGQRDLPGQPIERGGSNDR
jgi:CSLREA domain-containing protein